MSEKLENDIIPVAGPGAGRGTWLYFAELFAFRATHSTPHRSWLSHRDTCHPHPPSSCTDGPLNASLPPHPPQAARDGLGDRSQGRVSPGHSLGWAGGIRVHSHESSANLSLSTLLRGSHSLQNSQVLLSLPFLLKNNLIEERLPSNYCRVLGG